MTKAEREEQQRILERLRRDAKALAEHFRLPLRGLDAENANVKRRYGVCYDDGTIRIRLRHARSGRPLKYSGLVDTLCHELAHLKHFNHGVRFQAFYRRLLAHARRVRIYQPNPRGVRGTRVPVRAPEAPPRPEPSRQLELF